RELPERLPGSRHRALQPHDRGAGACGPRAVPVDSPPLQGALPGLSGLLRPAGAASRVSDPSAASYDLLIVGGGINATGVARAAAGRGLKVLLCEQDDLASHTSSASTKLIHGGLRCPGVFHLLMVRTSLDV